LSVVTDRRRGKFETEAEREPKGAGYIYLTIKIVWGASDEADRK